MTHRLTKLPRKRAYRSGAGREPRSGRFTQLNLELWICSNKPYRSIRARLTPSLPRPLDPAGLHGMLLFFVTPALALVLWGRWLGFALVLVSLAAFMCVSVVGDGMISN